MLCVHYVLCGRRRLTCMWACSCRSPPSVVARRWGRCGGWPRWPSGSRVRPWLPQKEKTRLTLKFSESLSNRSGSYFRPGKVFLCRNSSGVLFFLVSWQQREQASLVQPGSLELQLEGVAGQGQLHWLLSVKMLRHCLFLAHQAMRRNIDNMPSDHLHSLFH